MAAKVKQQYVLDAPSIYGKRPIEEYDDVETWVDRARIDRFILILPKTWDTILRADHTELKLNGFYEARTHHPR